MKKVYLILGLVLIAAALLVGCVAKPKPEDGASAYKHFRSALGYTSALENFETEKTVEKDGVKLKTVLKVKKTETGVVAEKKIGDSVEFYVDGVRYFVLSGENRKEVSSVDAFLEIGAPFEIKDENVRNVEGISGGVRFELATADFDRCIIEATYGDWFLTTLKVEVTQNAGGKEEHSSAEMRYVDAGKAPEITLPENLQEYSWL